MYRKWRQQWLLMPVLIMLTFSGSLLLTKNERAVSGYYVRTTVGSVEGSFSVAPVKHVTKSLAELGKMDEINRYVLFLNQIPNCGAEVLIFLLQKMQGPNNYRHVRLKGDAVSLGKIEQEQFVDEFYKIMRKEAVPLSFHRRIHFVNFTLFDKQSPTYINLIREPADKLISRSTYRPRRKDEEDLIECLVRRKGNCTGEEADPQQRTVPYFCGHDPRCLENGAWALQTAKSNVERFYPVVGVLEEMNATLEVLERKVPYFFKGVQRAYKNKMIDRFISKKATLLNSNIRAQLQRILSQEYEFYEWIKQRLFQQLQMLSGAHSH